MSADISERNRLLAIVDQFAGRKLVVAGDLVADQFLHGSISRVSREAPVLILTHEHTDTAPGGAANCAANLAQLGASVQLLGVVGNDAPGMELLAKLDQANVDCSAVLRSSDVRTTTKVRVLAGQIHSARQQVLRIDYEDTIARAESVRNTLRQALTDVAQDAHALIISDYNYGTADAELAHTARSIARARGLPLLVDSRFNLDRFTGFTSATPNEDEVEKLLQQRFDSAAQLEVACIALHKQLACEALLVTRGSNGMLLVTNHGPVLHLAAIGAKEPVDVTGAGDTVIAAYGLALAAGASFADAARVANHAGGIVVMKRGTATVSNSELCESLRRFS